MQLNAVLNYEVPLFCRRGPEAALDGARVPRSSPRQHARAIQDRHEQEGHERRTGVVQETQRRLINA